MISYEINLACVYLTGANELIDTTPGWYRDVLSLFRKGGTVPQIKVKQKACGRTGLVPQPLFAYTLTSFFSGFLLPVFKIQGNNTHSVFQSRNFK